MGDYILRATNDKKFEIPSEMISYEKAELGKFVFRNQDGIFVYERSLASKENFEKFETKILAILKELKEKYGKIYKYGDEDVSVQR